MSRYPSGAMSDSVPGDCPPDPLDADEPDVPEHLRHELETVEFGDIQPFEKCIHCERAAVIGRIDPFAKCPTRVREDPIARRAEAAKEDDEQEVLA